MDDAPRRLLIAEDDDDVSAMIAHVLAQDGTHVERVRDGFEALDVVERWRPDLLLLDLRLPDMDGWEVLRWLSRVVLPPPVLAVSAVADYAAARNVIKAGAIGFLSKPFSMRHLVGACRLGMRPEPLDRVPGAERRAQRRRGLLMPVRVKSSHGMHRVLLTDIAMGGSCVQGFQTIEKGEGLDMRFDMPNGPALQAEVRWRRPTQDGITCGLSFVDVEEDLERDLVEMERAPVLGC